MKKRKIAIITYEYPPVIGGAGIYAKSLFDGLKNQGYDVSLCLLAPNNKLNRQFKKIWEVIYLIRSLFIIWNVFRKDFDTIIINDGRTKKIYTLIYSFISKSKTNKGVVVMHGGEINTYFHQTSLLMKIFRIPVRIKNLLPNQKLIIVVSESEYSQWISFMPELKKNLKIIPHAVSANIFYPKSENEKQIIRRNLNLSDNDFIIFSASRLVPQKGQDTIIDAINFIKNQADNIKLIIGGHGPYKHHLKTVSKNYNIIDKVIFLGSVQREDLIDYYNIADLFILPSRYIESFGLVYIESFACKTPVISSNLGGVNNIVRDGINGYKTAPNDFKKIGDLILHLRNDRQILKILSENAYQDFKTLFDEKNMLNKLIYETDSTTGTD
ncbi:glycosyltransferase family 4 protein [Gaoshiqia sp. Z1-71]|uniref:glycosyltransferase family 4 protein n=1 Tax=Gaoshiqia hydrogeniformans TaxID=3290090 RepID=UPI003BF85940